MRLSDRSARDLQRNRPAITEMLPVVTERVTYMQHAKDTFYIMLRDRLAAVNPARTVLVRGVSRPAILVEENELSSPNGQLDTFRLRWTDLKVYPQCALPLATMRCEIHYATAGNSSNGGLDRGRLLATMDAELAAAVNQTPQRAAKMNYAASEAIAMQTKIFWSDVAFNAAATKDDRLERVATVEVFSYQEAGEL